MQSVCIEDGAIVNNELVSCKFWTKVQGRNPQTGTMVDHHDCAISWVPVLLLENSKVNRETGAAIDQFRNETSASNHNVAKILAGAASLKYHQGNSHQSPTILATDVEQTVIPMTRLADTGESNPQ